MVSRRRIGAVIRQAREAKSWSREQLGKRLGISQQAIYNYETALRPVLAEDLPYLASVLGIPVCSFFEPDAAETIRESKALYTFRKMREDYKDAALGFMESLAQRSEAPET